MTRTKKLIAITGIVLLGVTNIISICALDKNINKINELEDKTKFYEKVMYDFNIGEFVNYPQLFDDKDYVEQVKVHNCMWAFDLECDLEE